MEIHLATLNDINDILEIFKIARSFMIENNNPNQWENNYPSREIIEDDINKNRCYVCLIDNKIIATFTFIIGEDETYKVIKDGTWLSNDLYGTIHRLATNAQYKRISDDVFNYCKSKISHLRIDTHKDNIPMQKAIIRNKFRYCGIIFVRNKPRLAYEFINK